MTTHTLFFSIINGNFQLNQEGLSVNLGDIIIFSTDSSIQDLQINVQNTNIFGSDLSSFSVSEGKPVYRRVLSTAPVGSDPFSYGIASSTNSYPPGNLYING